MDIFALSLVLKEEGAATVKAATDKLRESLRGVSADATKMEGTTGAALSKLNLAAIAAGAAIGTGLVLGLKKVIASSSEAQFGQAQLAAALQSTGGAAGQTMQSLNAHADALQKLTIYDDDAINKAQGLLLTFTKIGGDTFPKATESVLNVATAMGTDLKSAALQVGKALNDPVAGVTALARAGIQFSAQQKETIKSLVETNRLVDAQAIVLRELETQFGGSARAAANTLGGALQRLSNAWENLFEVSQESTQGVVHSINAIADALPSVRTAIDPVIGSIVYMGAVFVSSVNVIWIAIQRMVYAIGGFITNIVLAPLTLLPVIGPKIAQAVDTINAGLEGTHNALSNQAEDWKDWREGVARSVSGADAILNGIRRTNKTVATGTKETTEATTEYNDALRDLLANGLATATEFAALTDRERELTAALATGNVPVLERIKLMKELQAIEQAFAASADARMKALGKVAGTNVDVEQAVNSRSAITRGLGAGVTALDPKAQAAIDRQAQLLRDAAQQAALTIQDESDQLAADVSKTFAQSFAEGIIDGFTAGIEQAVAAGNIGAGFKALAETLLAGLGSAMIQFGKAAIMASTIMAKIRAALATLNPAAGFAAGVAMVALGSALRGAAARAFGGSTATSIGGTGGTMSSYTPSYASGPAPVNRLVFGPTSATTAAGMTPRNTTNITVIGPNDPSAQRAIAELMRKAESRGNLG